MHDQDATPIEAIDFESLQETVGQNKGLKKSVNYKTFLWFAFILLLACAISVFIFLPNYVAEKRNAANSAEKPQVKIPYMTKPWESITEEPIAKADQQTITELYPEEISELKQQAEELLLQLIEKQKLLETKAVKKWASEKFKTAVTLGTSGDEYFRKQEYPLAIIAYKDAVKTLTDLEQQILPTLANHLQQGELALTQAEKNTAIQHFQLAKAIEPENTQANNGLQRAETIVELYTLLDKGGKFEATNRFVDAQQTYHKATELDPLSAEAKEALSRMSNRLAQIEFTRLMNQGHASLKIRQYGDSRVAFLAAQKLKPDSSKPKQGIAALEQAIREEKIFTLTAEAQHFENNQDWSNAVKSYQQILTVSPNSSSAKQALERNLQHEAMLAKLDDQIKNKLRLGSEKVASEAQLLVEEVALMDNPGSKIIQQTEILKDLLKAAKQPVTIILRSDNQTDIVIFKVDKFGKFEQLSVELKTGKYTIVGSRSGFRDVRKVITVTTDMQDKIVQIVCDEPI
jgi:hypothetical protein